MPTPSAPLFPVLTRRRLLEHAGTALLIGSGLLRPAEAARVRVRQRSVRGELVEAWYGTGDDRVELAAHWRFDRPPHREFRFGLGCGCGAPFLRIEASNLLLPGHTYVSRGELAAEGEGVSFSTLLDFDRLLETTPAGIPTSGIASLHISQGESLWAGSWDFATGGRTGLAGAPGLFDCLTGEMRTRIEPFFLLLASYLRQNERLARRYFAAAARPRPPRSYDARCASAWAACALILGQASCTHPGSEGMELGRALGAALAAGGDRACSG